MDVYDTNKRIYNINKGNRKKKFLLFQQATPFSMNLMFAFFQVSWVRYKDVSLIAVGKFVYISDDRFKVLHEPHSHDWFLVIKSVSYQDQGIYECQVNSEPPTTYKYRLRVVGKQSHSVLLQVMVVAVKRDSYI